MKAIDRAEQSGKAHRDANSGHDVLIASGVDVKGPWATWTCITCKDGNWQPLGEDCTGMVNPDDEEFPDPRPNNPTEALNDFLARRTKPDIIPGV